MGLFKCLLGDLLSICNMDVLVLVVKKEKMVSMYWVLILL